MKKDDYVQEGLAFIAIMIMAVAMLFAGLFIGLAV
jgi:hypothetical protein